MEFIKILKKREKINFGNVVNFKEIVQKRKHDIMRTFGQDYGFNILIGIIKDDLVSAIDQINNKPKKDQKAVKRICKPFGVFNKRKLQSFYRLLIEASDKKFPQYDKSCLYLSKHTPVIFRNYWKLRKVQSILRELFWHAYSLTKEVNVKISSANFYEIFQELLVELLKDYSRYYRVGFAAIKKEILDNGVVIKPKLLKAIVFEFYDEL